MATAMVYRNKAVVQMLQGDPKLTLTEVGRQFDISRERVRQIVNGIPGAMRHHPKREDGTHTCPFCGGIKRAPYSSMCKKCRTLRQRIEYGGKAFICEECGCLFVRTLLQVNHQTNHLHNRIRWCSKECQGAWLGQNHGRGG